MEDAGAHCVYVTDSGGRLTMHDVRDRVRAYREVLDAGHPDRHPCPRESVAVGRQLGGRGRGGRLPRRRVAARASARAPATAPSRRSSPSPTCIGWQHGCDLFALQDAADDLVRPLQDRPVRVDRETLTLGYAGVYSSFLRHAETRRRHATASTPATSWSRSAAADGRRPGRHDRRRRSRLGGQPVMSRPSATRAMLHSCTSLAPS